MKRILALACTLLLGHMAPAQLANLDFESWDSSSFGVYPTGWPDLSQSWLTRSTDPFQGDYALMVSVWYYYGKTVATQTAPIQSRPAAFTGQYTYLDNVMALRSLSGDSATDTAWVEAYLTRWDVANGRRDTVGMGILALGNTPAYAPFRCPITYTSPAQPDTISIVLDPSVIGRGDGYFMTNRPNGVCSFFTIDALGLEAATGTDEPSLRGRIQVYPNPAGDRAHVRFEGDGADAATVIDLYGRTWGTISLRTSGPAMLDLSELPAGVYEVLVTDARHRPLGTKRLLRME